MGAVCTGYGTAPPRYPERHGGGERSMTYEAAQLPTAVSLLSGLERDKVGRLFF